MSLEKEYVVGFDIVGQTWIKYKWNCFKKFFHKDKILFEFLFNNRIIATTTALEKKGQYPFEINSLLS